MPKKKQKTKSTKTVPKKKQKTSHNDDQEDSKMGASEWYWIQSVYNDLVISINPDTEDLNVWEKRELRSAYQLWKIDSDGYIISSYNQKVLDIDGADPNSGAEIILWDKLSGNRSNQKWEFTDDGHLKSSMNGFCIDIYDDDKGAGSQLMTWPERPHDWQKWRFVPADDGNEPYSGAVKSDSNDNGKSSAPESNGSSDTLESIQHIWDDIEEADVKRKKGSASCNICFSDDVPLFILSTNCIHTYCKECARNTLDSGLNTGNFPLRCPSCMAEGLDKERGVITRGVLKALARFKVLKALLAQRVLLNQVRNLDDEASIDHAYRISKPCPNCSLLIVHYRMHGCHHIAPGGGCTGCHHHFCWICLHDSGTSWTGCPNGCPPFCSKKCKACGICPDCAPGESCDACSGNCPACQS